MNYFKKVVLFIFLAMFAAGVFCAEIPSAFASKVEAVAEEDEATAISFENITEANFDQIPDSIHEIVKKHILNQDNGLNKEVSYAQSAHGKEKGEYIILVSSKKDQHAPRQHLETYVVTADGGINKVTNSDHLSKIHAFAPQNFYSKEKIVAHVKANQKKDNSFEGIRKRYNSELLEMAEEIEAIGLENITEEQARKFYQKRRELGQELKDESGILAKIGIYGRNLWKYQDVLGPSYDSFAAKGLTPAEIAIKAVTSGGGDIGLKSNAKDPLILNLNAQLGVIKEGKNRILEPQKHDNTIHKHTYTTVDKPKVKEPSPAIDTKAEYNSKSKDVMNPKKRRIEPQIKVWVAGQSPNNHLKNDIKINNKRILTSTEVNDTSSELASNRH